LDINCPIGKNAGLGEGSQLFKVNGKFLFNIAWPRGEMRTVVVHRADKITGPWEGKVAFADLGVAQGGIVDTQIKVHHSALRNSVHYSL